MDINLTIDNFLNNLFGDVDLAVPGEEKTTLGMCFYQSLKNKVYPAEFEANISPRSIKINPIDKPSFPLLIGSEQLTNLILQFGSCLGALLKTTLISAFLAPLSCDGLSFFDIL